MVITTSLTGGTGVLLNSAEELVIAVSAETERVNWSGTVGEVDESVRIEIEHFSANVEKPFFD